MKRGQDSVFAELAARARAAQERARAEAVRAEVLVAASAALREEQLTGQCAWCGRYRVAELWLPRDAMPRFAVRPGPSLSHTICPACVDELRRTGQSV